MPTPSTALLRSAQTGFHAHFMRGMESASPHHVAFCDVISSEDSLEEHFFPAEIPQLRPWTGQRRVHDLDRVWSYQLKNIQYEDTVAIKRTDFDDDRLGVHSTRFAQLGLRAATHPDKLWTDLLNSGFDDDCYDAEPFFSTSHPKKSGTQSNKATAALDADAYEAGRASLLSVTDYQGEPVDILSMGGKLELIVPPQLESTARSIVALQRLASGADNPNYNTADLRVVPRLAALSAVKWYLIAKVPMGRPFIRQNRSPVNLVWKDDPASDDVFYRNQYVAGVDVRYAMGYGFWQMAYGSTGAS